MKQKGFTLIELLVVVAIIGILAAVGVVAYNGYTSSAKKSAAKSNHKNVLKFISSEMQKCEILGYIELNYNSGNPSKVYQVTCDKVGQTTRDMALSFNEHFKNKKFKNPFDKNENGTACNLNPNYSSCEYKGAVEGQVIISITGSNIPKGNTFRISTKISNSETLIEDFDDPRY
tara:strand:- start:85 stop:606 length:522 start_codon:yes stop_codon:yes gene_type:complete